MSRQSYRKSYLLLWLLLAAALLIVAAISFLEIDRVGSLSLQHGTFREVVLAPEVEDTSRRGIATPQEREGKSRVESQATESLSSEMTTARPDTTVKSVLIFGDSMTVLVANRMAAYGKQNGYTVSSVTWDSSSSVVWSSCDTLDNFIRRYRPDFIMVTLGSNELFLKNFDKRRPYVLKILEKIGDIPFVWIGPPNWKEDAGFNAMMVRTLPEGTYFDSNGLDLPRGADHIHPTRRGGVIWTDSIMRWIGKSAHPIPAEVPDSSIGTPRHNYHYFKAAP